MATKQAKGLLEVRKFDPLEKNLDDMLESPTRNDEPFESGEEIAFTLSLEDYFELDEQLYLYLEIAISNNISDKTFRRFRRMFPNIPIKREKLNYQSFETIGDIVLNILAINYLLDQKSSILNDERKVIQFFRTFTRNRSLVLLARELVYCSNTGFDYSKDCSDRIEGIIGAIYYRYGLYNLEKIYEWFYNLDDNYYIKLIDKIIDELDPDKYQQPISPHCKTSFHRKNGKNILETLNLEDYKIGLSLDQIEAVFNGEKVRTIPAISYPIIIELFADSLAKLMMIEEILEKSDISTFFNRYRGIEGIAGFTGMFFCEFSSKLGQCQSLTCPENLRQLFGLLVVKNQLSNYMIVFEWLSSMNQFTDSVFETQSSLY